MRSRTGRSPRPLDQGKLARGEDRARSRPRTLPRAVDVRHQWPKRAVERRANHVLADVLVVLRAQVTEAKGEHGADADFLRVDPIRVVALEKAAVHPRSHGLHDVDKRLDAFRCDLGSVGGLRPGIRAALSDIARAYSVTELAHETGMIRVGIYKALAADGNPTFSTLMRITRVLGMQVRITV